MSPRSCCKLTKSRYPLNWKQCRCSWLWICSISRASIGSAVTLCIQRFTTTVNPQKAYSRIHTFAKKAILTNRLGTDKCVFVLVLMATWVVAPLHRRTCAGTCAFLRWMWRALEKTGILSSSACAVVHVIHVFFDIKNTFANTLAAGSAHVRACAVFFIALEDEGERFQPVYLVHCLVWEFIFDRRKDKDVRVYFFNRRKDKGFACDFSILTRVGVYVGVCACICIHTHTLHRLDVRLRAQESGWDTQRAWRIRMD